MPHYDTILWKSCVRSHSKFTMFRIARISIKSTFEFEFMTIIESAMIDYCCIVIDSSLLPEYMTNITFLLAENNLWNPAVERRNVATASHVV